MDEKKFNLVLEEGEGQYIEFKENLDRKFAKEVVAFANASGGQIFLGVDDSSKIKGVNITNDLKSKITDIAKNCDPFVPVHLEVYKDILIATIPEGDNKPYQCSEGFFMRIGPNSQKLDRNQILELSIKEGKIRFDEQICTDFDWKDFDDEKFEYFLRLAGISYNLEKKDILSNLKLLTTKGMTNAGVLFFAKEPFKYVSTSKIRCVTFRDNERVDILDKKEVDKGIIGNIEYATNYLKEHTDVRFEIKGIRRIEHPEYPQEAYREAIVNAIIHRDYFETGEAAVEKLKSRIIINNPGGLIRSLPKEEFGKLSRPRNRLLADILSKTIFMEKVGTGIRRIRADCKENNNSVELSFDRYNFFVTIGSNKKYPPKYPQKYPPKYPQKYPEDLNKTQLDMLAIIKQNNNITKAEMAQKLDLSIEAIKKNIRILRQKNIINFVGPSKGGYWKIRGE